MEYKITLFNEFTFTINGGKNVVPSMKKDKQQHVLAYWALTYWDRPPKKDFIEAIYKPAVGGDKQLSDALNGIGRLLDGRYEQRSDPPTIYLDTVNVDVIEFHRLVDQAMRLSTPTKIELLRKALALYHPRIAPGIYDDHGKVPEWLNKLREKYDAMYDDVRQQLENSVVSQTDEPPTGDGNASLRAEAIRVASNTRTATFLTLAKELQSKEARANRARLLAIQQKSWRLWTTEDIAAAEVVAQQYDFIGIPVMNGECPVEWIADSWGDSLRRCWIVCEPLILSYRATRKAPEFWDEFEKLARAAEMIYWSANAEHISMSDNRLSAVLDEYGPLRTELAQKAFTVWTPEEELAAQRICHILNAAAEAIQDGRLDLPIIEHHFGDDYRLWWRILEPWIAHYREEYSVSDHWKSFQWLGAQ